MGRRSCGPSRCSVEASSAAGAPCRGAGPGHSPSSRLAPPSASPPGCGFAGLRRLNGTRSSKEARAKACRVAPAPPLRCGVNLPSRDGSNSAVGRRRAPPHHLSRKQRANALLRRPRPRSVSLDALHRVGEMAVEMPLLLPLDDHLHLLVETPDGSLPKGMHRLNLGYAQSFNRRYGATGHVFEAPYYSGHVTKESHALLAVRYIALNPV